MTEKVKSILEIDQINTRVKNTYLDWRTLPILGILFYFAAAIFSPIFLLVLTFFIIGLVCIVLGIIDLFKSVIQKQSRPLFLQTILILYGFLLTGVLFSIIYFVLYIAYQISAH